NIRALFPGSTVGTTVGLIIGSTSLVIFTVDEANPDPSYLTTYRCDGLRGGVNVNQVRLFNEFSSTCTITDTYIGSRNAGGQANAGLKIITTVDNTNAAIAKQPSDFTVTVKS